MEKFSPKKVIKVLVVILITVALFVCYLYFFKNNICTGFNTEGNYYKNSPACCPLLKVEKSCIDKDNLQGKDICVTGYKCVY